MVLVVEGAINPNGDSEVIGQLLELRDSRNRKKNARYYDLQERFEQLAAYGRLEEPLQMRPLRDELWEIKTGADRVPFYFADATRKHKKAARITHQFAKATGMTAQGKTPRAHIDRGLWIAKGDREHD